MHLPRKLAQRSGNFRSLPVVLVQICHNSLSLQIHEIYTTGNCRQAPHSALRFHYLNPGQNQNRRPHTNRSLRPSQKRNQNRPLRTSLSLRQRASQSRKPSLRPNPNQRRSQRPHSNQNRRHNTNRRLLTRKNQGRTKPQQIYAGRTRGRSQCPPHSVCVALAPLTRGQPISWRLS